jgi:hypothetical protein
VLGPVRVTLTDTALTPQTSTNVPMGPASSLPVQALWAGPNESTATFLDPRPVVASLGPLPRGQQELFGVVPGSVPPFELLATEGGQLVRFTGLDPRATPGCASTCALDSTVSLSGLTPGQAPVSARAHYGGAELFVTTSTDGGVPVTARRSPSGAWSVFTGFTGQPASWESGLRSVRVDGTSVVLDTWNPQTQTFTLSDIAMTGVDPVLVTSGEGYVSAAVGPNRQFAAVVRNRSTLQWSSVTPTTPPQNIVSMLSLPLQSGIATTVIEQADAGISFVRHDGNNRNTIGITAAPVTGYDAVTFGGAAYVAYAQNGDLRFLVMNGGAFGGASGIRNFGGPPRVGFSAPYPVMLDVNPVCEAAYPRLAFVEDALIITWQERCAPETRWKVMSRVVR